MGRRVLLHIGFHKTGTTYLQDHVFNRAEKGFCAPWTVFSGEAIEHFVVTHPARYDPQAVANEFFLAAERLGHSNTIPVISHEDLCGYPVFRRYYGRDVAGRMHAAFPQAIVLIGIREQRSMLRSLYGQYIVQDGEWPISQFIGTGQERRGFVPICRLDHFEYHLLVDYYIGLFGKERVFVLPYELLKRKPVEYEQALHDFVGTGKRAQKALPPSNIGKGALTLAIRRRLNRFSKLPPLWDADYHSLPLSYRAKERFCRILERSIPKPWHEAEDRDLRQFIAGRVLNYYKESNRILSDTIGIDLSEFGYDM